MRKWLCLALLSMSPQLSGCAAALLVGAIKGGNAMKKESQAKEDQAYNEYVLGMEKINLEREKSNLSIRPIMSMEQWKLAKSK